MTPTQTLPRKQLIDVLNEKLTEINSLKDRVTVLENRTAAIQYGMMKIREKQERLIE